MIALADTSALIAREQGRTTAPPLERRVERVVVSIVTVGELRLGVLRARDLATRAKRLSTLRLAESLEPLGLDSRVSYAWADLVAALREAGTRMPVNDSWIAATALAYGFAVLTQDADYDVVPNLDVVRI